MGWAASIMADGGTHTVLHHDLQAAVAAAVWKPSCLTGATLELRRCEDDPAWGRWELETPMLVRIHANGEEESIPRPSPRCTVAQVWPSYADAAAILCRRIAAGSASGCPIRSSSSTWSWGFLEA